MSKRLVILLGFILPLVSVYGQYTQVGSGIFTRTDFGPITTDTLPAFYSRFAYIYPAASLTNLEHGDSISALSFLYRGTDSLRGKCNVKIYVKSTDSADFGTDTLNWLAATRKGMTLVYEGSPKDIISGFPSEVIFQFNKVDRYLWDTTSASVNLQILVEYTQRTNQVGRMPWYCEDSRTVFGFVSANETKYVFGSSTSGMDSMAGNFTVYKPTLKIYHPESDNDLEINDIYALGKVPILMNRADSIKVRVSNIGKRPVINRKVFLKVGGANSYKDTVLIDSIASFGSQFVYFTDYKPVILGDDSLLVKLDVDSNVFNNEAFKRRVVDYNEYSHSDPYQSSNGGIGFSGSTGDFVAKFYVDGVSYINQIKVDFSTAGRDFQLVVWDDDGTNRLPGTEIFVSDSSTTISGTFIMPVLPRIQVSGGYYVGIRQTSDINVGFSYQVESPVRPNTFYFAAPAQDTTWVPFSPGYNFNFNIQPRLQVAIDVAVLEISSPSSNDSIQYSPIDSIPLLAKFINYGYLDQSSFVVRYEIYNRFNQLKYSQDEITSILTGDTSIVNFGKFPRSGTGLYTSKISAFLSTDSVQDNNVREIDFNVVKDHDVGVEKFFTPTDNQVFSINRDKAQATLRVLNYGVKAQSSFKVVCELVNKFGNVVNYQERSTSIGPKTSLIVPFDSFVFHKEGDYTLRAYTILQNDTFNLNDSTFIKVKATVHDDMQLVSISEPDQNEKIALGTRLEPFITVRNRGRNAQDSVLIVGTFYASDNYILRTDSVWVSTSVLSESTAVMKRYTFDSLGDYRYFAEVIIQDDQVQYNDTQTIHFSVVTGNDLQLESMFFPTTIMEFGTPSDNVQLIVRNSGLNGAVNVPISCSIQNNMGVDVYVDTAFVTIDKFTLDTVDFKTVNFDVVGDYYVKFVNHSFIENIPNVEDTLETTYIVRHTNDLQMVSHRMPSDGDTLELQVKVAPLVGVMNLGLDSLFGVKLNVQFTNGMDQVVFEDKIVIDTISPSTIKDVESPKNWTANLNGEYRFNSWLDVPDENASNDSLSTNFYVVKRKDMEMVSIRRPAQADKLYKKSWYKPAATIQNTGLENATGVVVSCNVWVGSESIYVNSQSIDLKAGETVVVEFDSSLVYESVAHGSSVFTVALDEDQVSSNDTLTTDFEFVKGLDVGNVNRTATQIYPNPFTSQVFIESIKGIKKVSIFNSLGQLMYEKKYKNIVGVLGLDLPFVNGTYSVEIMYDSGELEKFTLVKAK